MADEALSRDELHEEHPGGGRFNQLLLIVIVTAAMIAGVVAAPAFTQRAYQSRTSAPRV
jgi:hypothetical protein